MQQSVLVSLIPLFPLLGAVVLGKLAVLTSHTKNGPSKGIVGFLAMLGPLAAFACALQLFMGLGAHPGGYAHTPFTWFQVGALNVPVAFFVDRLSGVMILIITGIGSLIHLYSIGYMHHERGFTRFFAYLNLFLSAMLILVLGRNVPMMFLGWEGVGACSYLLIGYYFSETDKAKAANKAFIVNRVGDFGLLLGMFALFFYAGHKGVYSLDFLTLKANAGLFTAGAASVIGLLFFVGAAGKSAQLPLHVWLADAMAGPTPVSALIHAATMVTAGVYMVARMSFLYVHADLANTVIATLGALTAFMAATIALTQRNIKKVLAYSTVSQLGYMFVGVAASAYWTGIFHVLTHAFFKALLFLGAGAVIHAMHHQEDMEGYGGLRKKLPFTFAVMLIGCLAIAGIPPFAGFFSKDAILAAAWEAGFGWQYALLLLTSGITAFYMFRMLYLTFFGAPRDLHAHEHAHEGPWVMNLPLAVLAVGTVLVGFLGLPAAMGGSAFAAFLAPAVAKAHEHAADFKLEYTLMSLAIIAGSLGILTAYLKYGRKWDQRFAFAPVRNAFLRFTDNKWGFDDAIAHLIVAPVLAVSRWGLWKAVDQYAIDGIVNGLPRLYREAAEGVRGLQTGAVRLYAYAMFLGTLAVLAAVVARFGLLRF